MRRSPQFSAAIQKFVLWAGQPASFLKNRSILSTTITLGTIAAVIIPVYMTGDNSRLQISKNWIWVVGAVLLVANFIDLLADKFDNLTSDDSESVLEDLAASQVSDLNSFIEQCCHISTLTGKSKQDHLEVLRKFLVIAASQSLGSGTRASYYTLEISATGKRRLCDPVHHLQAGRSDQSSRGFDEQFEPDNTIWNLLTRADTEPQIVEFPSDVDHIDWEKVAFKAYYSVPVKYQTQVFGFLSVNTIHLGSISESQRLAILGMARAYALTLMLARK